MDYQFMPDLTPEEYEALKADIAERGVLVPIELDEEGNVLDGHHRLRACEELGITDYPTVTREGMTEDEKVAHAYRLNVARRHLTTEQIMETVAGALRRFPEKSNREIASITGISHPTIGKYRRMLEASGQVEKVSTRKGSDGKRYTVRDRDAELMGRSTFTCCICGREFPACYTRKDGRVVNAWGYDPWPVASDGDCCWECSQKLVPIHDSMPEEVVNEHLLGPQWRDVLECAGKAVDALRERGHVDEWGHVWDYQEEYARELDALLAERGIYPDMRGVYRALGGGTTRIQRRLGTGPYETVPTATATARKFAELAEKMIAEATPEDIDSLTEITNMAKRLEQIYAELVDDADARQAALAYADMADKLDAKVEEL